jgi:acyl-CoA synthetase (AMP-forming)/AMP-acid ligase II
MLGLMMDEPLLLSRLIDYAAENASTTEVAGRNIDGVIERVTYAALRQRARRLAKALDAKGYGVDARVGSLAWNTIDHVELFYGVLGVGASLHTINPRLTPEHLAHMINQVDDQLIFIDPATIAIAESVFQLTPGVRAWIYMGVDDALPNSPLPKLMTKAEFLRGHDDDFVWPRFDERQAATICYTSGTTGLPKGVVYSHRSVTLNAMNMTMADMFGGYRSGALEVVMPIAPIFHSNGWNMPFTAPMNGHKLVLPGRAFDAASVIELIRAEGVTIVGAVPTVWTDIFALLRANGLTLPSVRVALIAGTRVPSSLFDDFDTFGIEPCQTWGMTEAPGSTRGSLPPGSDQADPARRRALRQQRQGRVAFAVQFRLVDEQGAVLPHDGVACGTLFARGATVAGRYLGQAESENVEWLDTGDIARIFPDGTMEIVDRAKDVIKSGGEWISTLQLESAATSHPAIAQAAAISVPHPRWQERPLLLCTLKRGASVSADDLRAHMAGSVAKWWLPDEILFIDAMPTTPTGKVSKLELRKIYGRSATQLAS